ncbi:MAG: hypothetical protein ACK4TA_23870 [Saprospiraceae bacterium]
MRNHPTILLLIIPIFVFAQQNELTYYNLARTALADGDTLQYRDYLLQANQLSHQFPEITYELAQAYSMNKQHHEAWKLLHALAKGGMGFPVTQNAVFQPFLQDKKWKKVTRKMEMNAKPILRSSVFYQFTDTALIPEGIAYDASREYFYIGSIHQQKIIRFRPHEKPQDIYQGLPPLGMKVHSTLPILYACVNDKKGQEYRSGLLRINLITNYIDTIFIDNIGQHLFNDLDYDIHGNAYITDSEAGAIYYYDVNKNEIAHTFSSPELVYPNGIVWLKAAQVLIVATVRGLAHIDLVNKNITTMTLLDNGFAHGIDGLYWSGNELIGVQNSGVPDRILKIRLNNNYQQILNIKVLEAAHSLYDSPTTGVISQNYFYYIANSCIGKYVRAHDTPNGCKAPVILRSKLH